MIDDDGTVRDGTDVKMYSGHVSGNITTGNLPVKAEKERKACALLMCFWTCILTYMCKLTAVAGD